MNQKAHAAFGLEDDFGLFIGINSIDDGGRSIACACRNTESQTNTTFEKKYVYYDAVSSGFITRKPEGGGTTYNSSGPNASSYLRRVVHKGNIIYWGPSYSRCCPLNNGGARHVSAAVNIPLNYGAALKWGEHPIQLR